MKAMKRSFSLQRTLKLFDFLERLSENIHNELRFMKLEKPRNSFFKAKDV